MEPIKLSSVTLRPAQSKVFNCGDRFRVLAAGRRFGKTELALVELMRAAALCPNGIAWYIAPNYRQAKQIAWERLKRITKAHWLTSPTETSLSVHLNGGATISVKGADNPDSLRGSGLDFVVLDEYANMRPECWTEVIRPALADKKGRALFIGTPQGCNHFYDRFEHAQNAKDWAAFQFSSLQGENVTKEELASAAGELDAVTFRQEFQAEFDAAGPNRVYYPFSRGNHVVALDYQKQYPLAWSLDFNVDPLCAVLAQRVGDSLHIIDEIVIKGGANTKAACEAFTAATKPYTKSGEIRVEIYGDASGHQRNTASPATDWGLIKEFFRAWRGTYQPVFKVGNSNPSVRERVNAVNAKLESASGERRLFIDPKCRELIKDLEKVAWLLNDHGKPTGEIDKRDKARTHISDALGYYVATVFSHSHSTVGPRNDGRLL